MYEISDEDLYKTISTTKKVAQHLKTVLKADGITIGQNNEKAGGQEIFHTHFHVIPRYLNDGYKEWSSKELNGEELLKIKDKLAFS